MKRELTEEAAAELNMDLESLRLVVGYMADQYIEYSGDTDNLIDDLATSHSVTPTDVLALFPYMFQVLTDRLTPIEREQNLKLALKTIEDASYDPRVAFDVIIESSDASEPWKLRLALIEARRQVSLQMEADVNMVEQVARCLIAAFEGARNLVVTVAEYLHNWYRIGADVAYKVVMTLTGTHTAITPA